MVTREGGGLMNVICWLIGHTVGGRVVERSYRNTAGELVDAWQQHCKLCSTQDKFPDRRNLYQRIASDRFVKRRKKEEISKKFL